MTDSRAERKRPSVLVLASTYPRWLGDPEPGFVHELAKRMVSDFNVAVLCPHAPGASGSQLMDGVRVVRYRYAPQRLETLVNDGGIVTNLRRQPWKWLLVPGFVLSLFWHTLKLTRQNKVSVIHAHWLIPQGLIVALARMILPKSVPQYVVTSHGADLFALRGFGVRLLKKFVVRKAHSVTVVSESMRDELMRVCAVTSEVLVRPMGVDLKHSFSPVPSAPRSQHEILFVGRLVEKKGLRDLIDALPTVLEQYPRARLTIAGFGPELHERKRQVEQLGISSNVKFIGAVTQSDLPALYRRAALFVAPFVQARSGDREGLGLVMVEALGCGCPVVTTRTPSVREVFSGWPRFLAEPGSPSSLATQIAMVFADPAAARAWAAEERVKVQTKFDYDGVAAAYVALLKAGSEAA